MKSAYAKYQTIMIKKIENFLIKQKIHFIGWGFFIVSESMLTAGIVGGFGEPLDYILHYGLNIVLFYTNALAILPFIFKDYSWKWRLPIGLVYVVIAYFLLKYLIDIALLDLDSRDEIPNPNTRKYVLGTIWRCVMFSGLSGFYYLFIRYEIQRTESNRLAEEKFQSLIRQSEMQLQLNKAEAAYLRAQINPHLLFNTINFIYDQVRTVKPKAALALITLSKIFRFSTENDQSNSLPTLQEEIKQVRHLIKLNQLRTERAYFLEFNYSKEVTKFRFIPLVLITLVENMFKHGDLRNKNQPGVINIWIEDNTFNISTKNVINSVKLFPSLNQGLKNIEKRLQLAYSQQISFKYSNNEENLFFTSLTLKIESTVIHY